jgi:hypothetical protein
MTTYTPTLSLRKVDPAKVIADYQAHKYVTLVLGPERLRVSATNVPSTTGKALTFRDKNNSMVVLHMINNSEIKRLPQYKPRCFWCLQDLTGTPVPLATAVTTPWTVGDLRYAFECSDTFCSFECALAYLTVFPGLRSAEAPTRLLHRLMHPGAEDLRPAPDFRLLDRNGGTMTYEEWSKGKSTFVQSPRVLLQPVAHTFVNT